jgi:hypothetical protein
MTPLPQTRPFSTPVVDGSGRRTITSPPTEAARVCMPARQDTRSAFGIRSDVPEDMSEFAPWIHPVHRLTGLARQGEESCGSGE